jgi:hypothetical protein
MGSFGKNIQRVKTEIEGTIVGQVSNFSLGIEYLANKRTLT